MSFNEAELDIDTKKPPCRRATPSTESCSSDCSFVSSSSDGESDTNELLSHEIDCRRMQHPDQQRLQQEFNKKSVRFSTVEIREFPMIMGNNPSVSSGPPLTIDWCQQSRFTVDFYDYDNARPTPRSLIEMRFDETLRIQILQTAGHTMDEIMWRSMECRREQIGRMNSVQSLQLEMQSLQIQMQPQGRPIREKLRSMRRTGNFHSMSRNSFSRMDMSKERTASEKTKKSDSSSWGPSGQTSWKNVSLR